MSRDRSSGRMRIPAARSPGAQSGPVRVHPRAPAAAPLTLSEAIQSAVEDAIVGENVSPGLAGRAKSAALAVLHRRGVRGGRVEAKVVGHSVQLAVVVPAGPRKVERVVLSVGVG